MNCANCGTQLSPDTKFCRDCGTRVQAPLQADPNKTLIATPMPAGGQSPGNQYLPPTEPLQAPGFTPPPNQAAQAPYGQPAPVGGPMQPQPMYVPPSQGAVAPTNGRIPAMIMLGTSIMLVISIFLPFLDGITLFQGLMEFFDQSGADVPTAAFLILVFPLVFVLCVVFAALALMRRRQLPGFVLFLFGLATSTLWGLFWLGFSLEADNSELGPAVPIMVIGGLVLVVTSIVYLARKKQPR